MPERRSPWSVAIIAARETIDVLAECIDAALIACEGQQAIIDVLVNGNSALADETGRHIAGLIAPDGIVVRAWFIPFGDKSHAWNEFVYRIYPGEGSAFLIDGYACVRPNSFALLDQALAAFPEVLGASAVPSSGRTAAALRAAMLARGGIHGNLYAISGEGMRLIRHSQFKLPLGLYRGDGLVGAVLMFRCNPAASSWDTKLIAVHPDATWDVRPAKLFSAANILSSFKRKLRQAQGHLENRAAREHLAVRKGSPGAIPRTVREFVLEWVAEQPAQARSMFLRQPSTYYAMTKLRAPRDFALALEEPQLISTTEVEADTASRRTPARAAG